MSLTLFCAITLPDEIADLLEDMQRGLDGAGWRPRENFHITLRYFGEMSEPDAEELDLALARIPCPPLTLSLAGVGSFGGNDPHAVWAGVRPNEALSLLSKRCSSAARLLGIPSDKHPFRPHVTLAYLKGISPAAVAAYAQRHCIFESPPFEVGEFGLYSRHHGKRYSRYIEEAAYPLTIG